MIPNLLFYHCRVAFVGSNEIKESEKSALQFVYPDAQIDVFPSGKGAGSGDLARLEQVRNQCSYIAGATMAAG